MKLFRFIANVWILSQCAATVDSVNQHLENKDFHHLTRTLRHFLYTCLCDNYLEMVKTELSDPANPGYAESLATLKLCLTTGLKLLHPVMPFVTEELFQRINFSFHGESTKSIMISDFPSSTEVRIRN